MAKMYPDKEPEGVSAAELLMYRAFAGLSDEHRVFHGVHMRWDQDDEPSKGRPQAGKPRRYRERRGECDFVLLHPRFGVLIIEVKGGKLRRDGVAGAWFSEDTEGAEHQLKDPFEQAESNKHAVIGLLAEGVGTRRFDYRVEAGVALPYTLVQGAITSHAPRHAVIDSSDLPDIQDAVERLYGGPLKHQLSREAVEAATDRFSPTFALTKVGLNAQFQEIERKRLNPTDAQRFLLDHFEHKARASVQGCAGSGKTLIALEKARRLARAGQRVLFLCYNRKLADWAELAVYDGSFERANVKVRNFHRLADEACVAAGMTLFANDQDQDWSLVPQRMEQALAKVPMKFDAVVVDEGQDFHEEWWLIVLSELLARPDEDPFYVFYDPNQRIYGEKLQLPADLDVYPLTHNLRNTRQIHQEVVRYYQGDEMPECLGPEGVDVERIAAAPLKGVQAALDELVNRQGVPTEQIVVLTGRAQDRSDFGEGRRLGNIMLTWHAPRAGEVQVATVHAFKGLERPVVVLTELDHLLRDPTKQDQAEKLLYVGASRAINHLVLVGAELARVQP